MKRREVKLYSCTRTSNVVLRYQAKLKKDRLIFCFSQAKKIHKIINTVLGIARCFFTMKSEDHEIVEITLGIIAVLIGIYYEIFFLAAAGTALVCSNICQTEASMLRYMDNYEEARKLEKKYLLWTVACGVFLFLALIECAIAQ